MITMKDIIREGHETLRKRSDEVSLPVSDSVKKTLTEMRTFLVNSQSPEIAEQYELRPGVGLAAPQINVPLRMLAIYTLDENLETMHDYLMVNPVLISHSESQTYMPEGEGCLSVDRDIEGLVPRYQKVTVETYLYDYISETLTKTKLRLKGFAAVVFQHELDHLNGVLFFDRVKTELSHLSPIEFKTIDIEEEQEL